MPWGAELLLVENQWLRKEVKVFLSSTAHIQRALVDLPGKTNCPKWTKNSRFSHSVRGLGCTCIPRAPKRCPNGQCYVLATGCKPYPPPPGRALSGSGWNLSWGCLPAAWPIFSFPGLSLAMLIFREVLQPTRDISGLACLLQLCTLKCQILPLS